MKQHIILSGRYELLRSLGSGTTGNVYLARHISLESTYAIKVFPKKTSVSLYVLSEARLLQSLRHPAIPIVHDLEEDEDNYYLIEEYVVGESLEEYLLHHGSFSPEQVIQYFEQLCDVFIYLHNQKPSPVCYSDLKPEHIIVCGFQLKIIDFGSSFRKDGSENDFKCYGNLDYSAPEITTAQAFTEKMTVYSLGRLLIFMAEHTDSPVPRSILTITQKAISSDPSLRYETVEALWFDFQQKNKKEQRTHLLHNIAVVGACAGCGTTHIAIALTSVLNYLGHHTFYYEKNPSGRMREMKKNVPHMTEHPQGYYVYRHFQGFPEYGPGIEITPPKQDCCVNDFGCDCLHGDLSDADLILLVCSDMLWKRADAIEQAKLLQSYSAPVCIISNPGSKKQAAYLSTLFSAPVFTYYNDDHPFRVDKKKKMWIRQLLSEKGGEQLSLHTAKKHTRNLKRLLSAEWSTTWE